MLKKKIHLLFHKTMLASRLFQAANELLRLLLFLLFHPAGQLRTDWTHLRGRVSVSLNPLLMLCGSVGLDAGTRAVLQSKNILRLAPCFSLCSD